MHRFGVAFWFKLTTELRRSAANHRNDQTLNRIEGYIVSTHNNPNKSVKAGFLYPSFLGSEMPPSSRARRNKLREHCWCISHRHKSSTSHPVRSPGWRFTARCKFGSCQSEKCSQRKILTVVWPGGDIYPTRHMKDWFGASESFWLFSGAEQDWTKDF